MHRTPPLLFTSNVGTLKLIPYFVYSKHRPDSGFLLPTNLWDYLDPLFITPHEWADRRDENADKLFWRGPVNGWNWYKGMASRESGITWRNGSRPKLSLSFNPNVDPEQEVEVLLENNGPLGGLVTKTYKRAWLNEKWTDIGLSGSAIQCHKEEGTCSEMQNASMWKGLYPEYKLSRMKFVVDVGVLIRSLVYYHFRLTVLARLQ